MFHGEEFAKNCVWYYFVLDNDNIKEAIQTYGAIFSSFYWSASRYNSSTYGYYYSGTTYSNHAITLVGWDDNYSKDNFNPRRPSGDGAFIVKIIIFKFVRNLSHKSILTITFTLSNIYLFLIEKKRKDRAHNLSFFLFVAMFC